MPLSGGAEALKREAHNVTAPATEVAGIYGLSTNAMPPQGDHFMASMITVPDFTYRTSLYNLISGVLRSSMADVATASQLSLTLLS